jgi:ankyrin repeat protein
MKDIDFFFDLVEKGETVKVRELIQNGFDINQKNNYGSSVMHIVVFKDLLYLAKLLIDSGININVQNKEGKTSLHYVAEYNRIVLGRVLLDNGADLSIQDKYGNQPLWTAVFNDKGRDDRIEVIKLFIQYGADINHKNDVGKSPKDIVIIAGYKNLVNVLL